MKKWGIFVLIGALVIFFGLFFFIENQENKNQKDGERIIEVVYEVDAPFSIAKLTIVPGRIAYDFSQEAPAKLNGSEFASISEEKFNKLADLINKNNFWSLNESYFNKDIMDASLYTITIKSVSLANPELSDQRVYSVSCNWPCPEEFMRIKDKIKEIWGRDIIEAGM